MKYCPQGPIGTAYRKALVFLGLALAVTLVGCKPTGSAEKGSARGPGGRPGGNQPVPVVAGTVEQKDVPIYLDGLGTVQAYNTVLVRSRVDGQVEKIAFTEGQDVQEGDLLAQIDPRPFQAQLDQAKAKQNQDQAQLTVAQLNLTRAKDLLASKIMAQADYDTQAALVQQLQASVQADEAAIQNAQTQLGYTTIRSPLNGRTGIRLVDQGNIVHASDVNGLVVITQLKPISVVFTLPEQDLHQVQEGLAQSGPLAVQALGREDSTVLAEGTLTVIDNQIDTSTGTLRLKATFPNNDFRLWPGQFVNVRLLVQTRKHGTVVPASVVQRGPDGAFAYVISNGTAVVRPLKVGQVQQGQALIDQGLTPGERVVVDGQYKLQPGAKVEMPESGPKPAQLASPPVAARNLNP